MNREKALEYLEAAKYHLLALLNTPLQEPQKNRALQALAAVDRAIAELRGKKTEPAW